MVNPSRSIRPSRRGLSDADIDSIAGPVVVNSILKLGCADTGLDTDPRSPQSSTDAIHVSVLYTSSHRRLCHPASLRWCRRDTARSCQLLCIRVATSSALPVLCKAS